MERAKKKKTKRKHDKANEQQQHKKARKTNGYQSDHNNNYCKEVFTQKKASDYLLPGIIRNEH